MPKVLLADYSEIRAGFCKGVPLTDLAKQFNVNLLTLRSRAQREKWTQLKAKADESLHKVRLEAGLHHVGRIAEAVDHHLSQLEKINIGDRLADMNAEAIVRTINTLDLIGRRAHRLDEQQGVSKGVSIALTVNNAGQPGSANSARVIELEQDVVEQAKLVNGQQDGQQVRADSPAKD